MHNLAAKRKGDFRVMRTERVCASVQPTQGLRHPITELFVTMGLSRILNKVVMRDWSIPLFLRLNEHFIILKTIILRTYVIKSPILLMQYLHGRNNDPYL